METQQRYRITTAHGEGRSLFYVVDAQAPEGDSPAVLATCSDRESADFLLDLLDLADDSAKALRLFDLTESDEGVEAVLAQASEILEGYGVERVAPLPDGRALRYVNNGETYSDTLAHDGARYLVTSWGAFVEAEENSRAEETRDEGSPEGRCGYCSEWGDASTRSTCCGGYHADGSPSGFHSCTSCGRCAGCGSKQGPRAFDGLDAWEEVATVSGRTPGVEAGPEPFDDLRANPPGFALHGLESEPCPECRGDGTVSRGDCPTCRGFGDVVPHSGGFLARDGLARYY